MTIAQKFGEANQRIEQATRAGEFITLAKHLLAHKGKFSTAAMALNSSVVLSPRLRDIVKAGVGDGISREAMQQKAVVSAGTLAASNLADYSLLSAAFVGSLVSAGAFDALVSSMVPVPLTTGTVGAVTVGATAYGFTTESQMKPITRLSVTNQQMTPQKAVGVLVVTQELARSPLGGAAGFIGNQLRAAVAVRTDAEWLAAISSGVAVNTSTGATATAVRADIAAMLQQVSTGQNSKLFIVTTPLIAKMWATLDSAGMQMFDNVTATGGSISGIPIVISDGVPAGMVYLIDASGLAGNAGEVALQEYREGMGTLDSAPDSPPTSSTGFISFWQLNLSAIVCERFFCGVKLRSDAVAACLNSNSYTTGNSPP